MFNYDLSRMLYTIPVNKHEVDEIDAILAEHAEVKFVSLTGVDLGGHSTDEKIPVKAFREDMAKILWDGVQTDGSSVALPTIADLSNARVDILPDKEVNWYVEYNFANIDYATGLPTGTLRIPSFLRHNNESFVGSRIFCRRGVKRFKRMLLELLREHPYVFEYIEGADSVDDIEEIVLTSATELEFWVKTPDDSADRNQLLTSQELKEQYWKRTVGPVATALEESIELLDHYGFEIEMGHKEVGGVRAKMGNSGVYDHIMEQIEIDWKYAVPLQAADNEVQVKHIVRDIFRAHGLEVTFLAKPMAGVAGNGEHTHLGVAAKLKNGKKVNLFAAKDAEKHYMNPIGFGALMGIMRNYELLNPFIAQTHDAFQRLKPGFEAPVCIVTSLGQDIATSSRNRTVLIGLVRDANNPMATRFELRSPNPHSNTFLILGASFMLMLDGIRAVLEAKKTPEELAESISKKAGDEDFYLEKDREYRSEKNVFTEYTEEERERLFGKAPATVWENFRVFDERADELVKIAADDKDAYRTIHSYHMQMLSKWVTEFHDRIIPNAMDLVRQCKRCHDDAYATDYDLMNWRRVNSIRVRLGKDSISEKSILTLAKKALEDGDYEAASKYELEIQNLVEQLHEAYREYTKNLF